MEPIISPWFIYFLEVVDTLKEAAEIMVVIGIGAVIGTTIWVIAAKMDFGDYIVPSRKSLKAAVVGTVIASFLWMFVPSKSTLIGMAIADNITTDNITKALEAGHDVKEAVKQDIFELIDKLQKKSDGKKLK